MRQHSGALERKWNRQLTRPIFPAGTKNAVWKRDCQSGGIHNTGGQGFMAVSKQISFSV